MKYTKKFQEMKVTAKGEERASVKLRSLDTLWFNTGTLCNLECKNCYIESSPKNDRLSYLSVEDVDQYLIEIKEQNLGTRLIGLTGGEPFLNPSIMAIIEKNSLLRPRVTHTHQCVQSYEQASRSSLKS